MCGLVGMMGNAFDQDKKVLRDLLWLDKFRGSDSTGLAVIGKKDNAVHMYKKVGTPDKMFQAYKDFDDKDMYTGPEGKMWIGHNRAATRGKVTDENAHPFHHDTIVGAHNGTLKTTYQLDDASKFDVDSEAIFYNLNKAFDNEKVIGKIHGAYALVWYDNVTDNAHFIRNKERPLYYTRRKDNEVVYWASLPWMLEYALAYNNVQHNEIFVFGEDTLYTFDLGYKTVADLKKTFFTRTENVKGWVPSVPLVTTKSGGTTTSIIGGKSGTANPFSPPTTSTSPPRSSEFSTGSMNSQTKGAADRTKEEKLKMKSLQGKEIKFRFEGLKINEISNTPYIKGYFSDPMIDYEVRVFGAMHPDWMVWQKNAHFCTYRATVKRMVENNVRGKKNCYLLLDMRTIEPLIKGMELRPGNKTPEQSQKIIELIKSEVANNIDAKAENDVNGEQMYEGFNGHWLTKEQWDKATEDGCSGCMKPIEVTDENLKFIDHNQCLCGGCAQSDAYSSVVTNFKN